jgi:Bacterial protein of unknown function (HtrL_YibB)
MKEVTIVTSLFNIERDEIDGRKWEEYLKWFSETLKLKCSMIIFVSEDLVSFVEEKRKEIPTEIIVNSNEEIPYNYLKERIDLIIESDEYKEKISDPQRIECKHSLYSIIQYSKFKWLLQAVEENPFNSKFFFWLDAGASRFFDNYDLNLEYPSPNAIEALKEMGEKFLVQMNMEYYKDLANSNTLSEDYLLDNRSYILGSMFGGTEKEIIKVSEDIEDIFVNKMIDNGFVNNEQIALGYLVKQNPDDYEIYERYDEKHMSLFKELGKR